MVLEFGHYDAVETMVETEVNSSNIELHKCRCGINTMKKDQTNVVPATSCTNNDKTVKYKSPCPCLRSGKGCGDECRCVQCANPYGKRKIKDIAT